MAKSTRKIHIETLGCAKNIVDSEKLAGQLKLNQLTLVPNIEFPLDSVIINTCGFIHDAKQESINTILEFIEAKEQGHVKNIYVMGCLSQRYKDELMQELPEVDGFFGVDQLKDILKQLDMRYTPGGHYRELSTLPHYAYLKVSEGCDRQCAFCAIPLIRGPHKSIPIEDLIAEAKSLANNGVKELILIAQDLTYYGVDLYKKQALATLLNELVKIDSIGWIRLHYTYPTSFPLEVLDIMNRHEKICKYIDIPFQHIHSDILRNMKRGINQEQTYQLIDIMRAKVPGIAIRSTLMTGFPGEGKHQYDELKTFVERVRFDRLGIFTYSEEEGTAAFELPDIIPQSEKQQRADELMEIQQNISLEINEERIGNIYKTIIDRKEGEYWIGRTEYDSPEVDQEVLISSNHELQIGEFYMVEITGAEAFDLYGSIKKATL